MSNEINNGPDEVEIQLGRITANLSLDSAELLANALEDYLCIREDYPDIPQLTLPEAASRRLSQLFDKIDAVMFAAANLDLD